MAHYALDTTKPLASQLKSGLSQMRNGKFNVECVLGVIDQMSTTQMVAAGIGADTTDAANAKAELESDMAKLNTDATQDNVHAATEQMFNQFG